MKQFLFLSLLLCLKSIVARSQLDNQFFYDTAQQAATTETLYFSLDVMGLHRNTEYFNPIVEGRTLFATHTLPTLLYAPVSSVLIEMGAFLWKDFGNTRYSAVEPFFRFTYKKPSLRLIVGNLESSLTHQLIEPLYDFERFHTDRTEQGIQLKVNKKWIYTDLWVDWRKMIYQNSPFQEEIVGGANTICKLYSTEKWKIHIPLQVAVKHLGGQINVAPPPDSVRPPAFSLWNAAIGADLQLWTPHAHIKAWNISGYWVHSYNDTPLLPYVFQQGQGSHINLKASTHRWGDFYLSHWWGNEYSSAIGGVLFRSESTIPSQMGYTEKYRHLLIVRYSRTWHLSEDVALLLRVEPYHDLYQGRTELAWSFYVRYQPLFALCKLHSCKKKSESVYLETH